MKNIIVVGDSYTYGEGCSDLEGRTDKRLPASKHCWASLLERAHSNITVHNFSGPGLDHVSIARNLWTNIDSDTDVVLFCGTFYGRLCVRHPNAPEHANMVISMNPHFHHPELTESKDFGLAMKLFYSHLYSNQVAYDVSTCTVLSAYACAVLHGAKFFWSMPTQQFDGEINPVISAIQHLRFTASCDINYDKYCIAPCRHPNDQGHELYYNNVISDLAKNF